MKYIESDNELSMRGEALLEAITHDRAAGLLPFFVSIVAHAYEKYFGGKNKNLVRNKYLSLTHLSQATWI